jgi:hypothetical protein
VDTRRVRVTQWQPAGPDDDPDARLVADIALTTPGGDVTLYLDAIAVHVVHTVQSATHPDLDATSAGTTPPVATVISPPPASAAGTTPLRVPGDG